MKNYLLLIIIVIGAKCFGQSNIYHPFPDSSARWEISSIAGTQPPFPAISCCSSYEMVDVDTIIGSNTYKKIKAGFSPSWLPEIFALREDISNKKVYVFYKDSINESLLYDFGLNIGDTFFARPLAYCSEPSVVSHFDSISKFGSYRKTIHFSNSGHTYLIEGIGSNNGLIAYDCFEGGFDLCRFIQNHDTFKTPNSLCGYASGMDNLNDSYIKLYPTILNTNENLHIDNPRNDDIEVNIVNPQGKILFALQSKKFKNEVEYSILNNGLNIVIITNKRKIIKVIKILKM